MRPRAGHQAAQAGAARAASTCRAGFYGEVRALRRSRLWTPSLVGDMPAQEALEMASEKQNAALKKAQDDLDKGEVDR